MALLKRCQTNVPSHRLVVRQRYLVMCQLGSWRSLFVPPGTYSRSIVSFSPALLTRFYVWSARNFALLVVVGLLVPRCRRHSLASWGCFLGDNAALLNPSGLGVDGAGFNHAAKDTAVNSFAFQSAAGDEVLHPGQFTGANFTRGATGQHAAFIQHHDGISDGEGGVNVMGYDDRRHAQGGSEA